MDENRSKQINLSHKENIKQASNVVKTWPKWKVENMQAYFSEPYAIPPEIFNQQKDIIESE